MKYDEIEVGAVIEVGPYTLGEAELLDFARAWDPQWFHTDADAAAAGRFGGLIASGWQTCAIAMRLGVDGVLRGSESFASPGVERIRWPHPVRAGDTLRLKATILDKRRSTRKPTMGILRWRWQLLNQDGVEVLDMDATSLFDLPPHKP
jgi:acyl dehydratase